MFQRIQDGRIAVALCSSLFLAACGGGGSSSDGGDQENTSATLRTGAFYTTVSFDGGGSAEAITFLSPTGKFLTAFDETDITFGTLQFSNGNISGGGTDYVLSDTWEQTDGEISGTVNSKETASLTATAPGYSSQIEIERENTYSDLGVTLDQVSGTYLMSEPGFLDVSVTISSDGTVTGNDESGCAFNGTLTIPDEQINIFEVSYTAATCGDSGDAVASERNGDYSGLGAYDPDLGELEFAGRNGQVAVFFIGTK